LSRLARNGGSELQSPATDRFVDTLTPCLASKSSEGEAPTGYRDRKARNELQAAAAQSDRER
jgi:hypothetical protein